ncbi:trypsin-like serine peptidase [Bdellovibrio sp. HCB290]|uniref:trypsin-like serine peptidase n=1 Tax=Bdellovibrio sp. HCB290 TaxID=3394356 RepID=UPI0039B4DAA4
MKQIMWALCSLIVLAACSEAPQNIVTLDKNQSDAVVYGEDSVALPQETSIADSEQFQNNVSASVAMVYRSDMTDTPEGFVLPTKTVRDSHKTCTQFRLSESQNPAQCSAVLVAPNLILTAGHCMNYKKDTCADAAFVFGFNQDTATMPKDQVYFCKQIRVLSFFEKGNLSDYALVELDRAVPDITPVKIKSTPMELNDTIYTLGYPLGTAKKYADGFVRGFDRILAISNLDVYGGNSGGPVFDKKTHELVGIINSGENDLEETAEGCQMPKLCKDDECMGENILPTSFIVPSLKEKGEAFASPVTH